MSGKLTKVKSSYIASVGMEVHAELLTESKMFCRCPVGFGGEPNTRVCPVCTSMPGSLPVPNKKAIELVLKTALALNCKIAMHSIFHRKNYFYPDLPKGYQISQYGETNPLGYHGWLDIPTPNGPKRIHIRRVHLEEDTGKLIHVSGDGSGVDYNRAGVPLMEIVTDFPPDITTADEAKQYLVQLRLLLLYLGVCDGKMEEGSLRCEPNVSIRLTGTDEYGTKTELKNLNSFRSVQLGVDFEVARQSDLLNQGQKVVQETRGWNEEQGRSYTMRVKEEENDYRYFPDPDLLPMAFDESYIEELRKGLPELPLEKTKRYQTALELSEDDADRLVADPNWARFFETAVELGGDPKLVCNWMVGDLAKRINEDGSAIDACKVKPQHVVELIELIQKGAISGKIAKQVLKTNYETGDSPRTIVDKSGLTQIEDVELLRSIVDKVIQDNEQTVVKYKSGQVAVAGFLIGLVMKQTQGRANPTLVKELVEGALNS